jgi:TonB family protein
MVKFMRIDRTWSLRYSTFMVLVLFLILAVVAAAQSDDSARALLQQIAASARAAKTWEAEGRQVSDLSGQGIALHSETQFKSAFQSPNKVRSETSTQEEPLGKSAELTVCDGADHWSYYTPGTGFYRSAITVSPCEAPMGDLSKLAENLLSAAMAGTDHVAGVVRSCELVRAEYVIDNEHSVHMMCIDPQQKIVLRDRTETETATGLHLIETTTYTSFERNTKLSGSLFQFQVPTGTFEDAGPILPGDTVVVGGVYRRGPGVVAPELISKVEPSYTEQAREAGVFGIVLISFQVNVEGKPEKLAVVRGLGPSLNEKAIEAVRQWQFHPGTKAGIPVPVGPLTVAVSFRQP